MRQLLSRKVCQKVFVQIPPAMGLYYSLRCHPAKQGDNCEMNLPKHFLANLLTELLTRSAAEMRGHRHRLRPRRWRGETNMMILLVILSSMASVSSAQQQQVSRPPTSAEDGGGGGGPPYGLDSAQQQQSRSENRRRLERP